MKTPVNLRFQLHSGRQVFAWGIRLQTYLEQVIKRDPECHLIDIINPAVSPMKGGVDDPREGLVGHALEILGSGGEGWAV